MSHRPRWDSTAALKSMLTDPARSTSSLASADQLVAQLAERGSRWDLLSRAQWLEMKTLLPGYILASQGDRMLMGNSIEGRFPFLDVEVGRYANSLPPHQKLLGLDEKHLLKRAFADLLPDEILRRPKQPYRAPDGASFFAHDSPDWIGDVTSEAAIARTGVFRWPLVDKLMQKGRRSHGIGLSNTDNMRLVAVLSTQLLSSQVLGPRQSPPAPMTVFDFSSRSTVRA